MLRGTMQGHPCATLLHYVLGVVTMRTTKYSPVVPSTLRSTTTSSLLLGME